LKILEEKEEDLYQYLSTYGTDSRSFAQLLKAMVVNSEEEATDSIEDTQQNLLILILCSGNGFSKHQYKP